MRAPDFWTRTDGYAGLVGTLLAPLGWAYGASVAYKAARARPYRANALVICVGNLSVGGTGKTPLAIVIARMLQDEGHRPVFLSRGYGGRQHGPLLVDASSMTANEIGDEPLLLARHGAVIVARDRRAGAMLAEQMAFDTIVMDDGHQNFALDKDLSLVVIDGEEGFGNGRLVPAGPLREPVAQGLGRADAVVVVGGPVPDLGSFGGLVLQSGLVGNCEPWRGKRVVAFAGIGRPEKFFATARACGVELAACIAFPDHHPYTTAELFDLARQSKELGAILLTTEKDFARLMPEQRREVGIFAVEMRLADPLPLRHLLTRPRPRS
jgi:tetraacyldisaccharide 4'-kinase